MYRNLKDHPQLWIPPIKELHYFNQSSRKPWALAFFYKPETRNRLRRLAKHALYNAKKGKHLNWYFRYFFLPRNDKWYSSLFSPGVGQIAGEITPGYSILDSETVDRIHRLMPNTKIIFLLRNPIERTWSQANRRARQVHFQGKHTDETVIQQFMETDDENPHRRSDYLALLQLWENFYPQEQIFIGFFEQIAENPRQLLSDLYQFLDVDSSQQYIPNSVHQKVHMGHYSPIPAHWARYLAEKYYEQLKLLHDRFDNRSTASWLEGAEQYLSVE